VAPIGGTAAAWTGDLVPRLALRLVLEEPLADLVLDLVPEALGQAAIPLAAATVRVVGEPVEPAALGVLEQ